MAGRYSAKVRKIEDGKNWEGLIGYLKAGYLAATRKSVPATYEKPSEEEPVVLVFPIWAGGFPPVVRSFVNEVGRRRILCVPTSLGSTLKDREGFMKVIDLVGKTISAPQEL